MAANLTIYCLEKLTDYSDFERLCHDLMLLEGYSSIEPLGGFKDKGRDAIYVSKTNETTIFAYSVREDWRAKLAEDASKINKHGHKCNQLVFITTAQPTAGERDEAVANIHHQYDWQLEIYGNERLRIFLDTKYPQLKKNHPSIFPPEFIAAQVQLKRVEECDHLFISYAPKDRVLADWLAKRLTAEGYLVWCEHLKLLGGEKFPEDVDQAIKNQTFCLIALYSQSSLINPDLILQRSIALTIAQEKPKDFLIPIDVDGIEKTKLDSRTRLLKFILFQDNWAEGLKNLLKKLESVNCPKPLPDAAGVALAAFFERDTLLDETETVFSNYFKIEHIPKIIHRYEAGHALSNKEVESFKFEWACRQVDSKFILSFHQPPNWIVEQLQIRPAGGALWQEVSKINGIWSKSLGSELIKKALIIKCHQKGLKYCPESKLQYFPQGLVERNRLKYIRPDGSKSRIHTCGTRTFRSSYKSEKYQYFLAPNFYIDQDSFDAFSVIIRIKVRLSDINDLALKKRKSDSRRKHLCKRWWNHDWFNRMLAVSQFLADEDKIIIGEQENNQIIIQVTPLKFTAPIGIDESTVAKLKEDRAELLDMLDSYEQEEDINDSESKND